MKHLKYLALCTCLMLAGSIMAEPAFTGWVYTTDASCKAGSSWHWQCGAGASWQPGNSYAAAYIATCQVTDGLSCATSGPGVPANNRFWTAIDALALDTRVRICSVQPAAGRDGCPAGNNFFVPVRVFLETTLVPEEDVTPENVDAVIGYLQGTPTVESYWIVEMDGQSPEYFDDSKAATLKMVRLVSENPERDVTIRRTGFGYTYKMIPAGTN